MSTSDDFIRALRATREEYDSERTFHRFLLDAYAGTGGFQGAIRMPFASYWGAAADLYGRGSVSIYDALGAQDEQDLDTYLDRFPREDSEKFGRRVSTTQYPNYIEPIVDIRLSFLWRKAPTIEGADHLSDWMEDADGRGSAFLDVFRETVSRRAAWVGWCPILIDSPVAPPGMSVAQAEAAGIRSTLRPLWPANLLDWELDERGDFAWAKTSICRVVREDALSAGVEREVIRMWYPDRVAQVILERDSGARDAKWGVVANEEMPNPHGVVPLVIVRHKPSPESDVHGLPMAGSPSILARKLFNYLSELDEHVRKCVFAFLQVPVKNPEMMASLNIGNGNALPIPLDATKEYRWVTPPSDVAAILETRIERTVQEIYRTGRSEFERAKGGGVESGVARAIAFENTNRAIADFAASLADGMERALRLASRLGGTAEADIQVTPQRRFDVEEMGRELDEALVAQSLALPPTASVELVRRLIDKLLPNVSAEVRRDIDAELEEMLSRKLQEAVEPSDLLEPPEAPEVPDVPPGTVPGPLRGADVPPEE